MYIKKISELGEHDLTEIMGEYPPVVFLGSGISIWSPSGLPSGKQFVQNVFSFLFKDDLDSEKPPDKQLLEKYFYNLPFEVINEMCPDSMGIERLLKKIYEKYDPNPIHRLLARAFLKNDIQSIITPNYDCCLDAAIDRAWKRKSISYKKKEKPFGDKLGNIFRIINKSQVELIKKDEAQVYFKIHGSTDDLSGESIVFRLNQEGVLPQWKSKLFRKIIHDKTLLVIGYSGSDFDICPEIALAKPKKIVWNFLNFDKNDISPSISFLNGRSDLTILEGDMRKLLGMLYKPVKAEFEKNSLDIRKLLEDTFGESVKRLWKARTYYSINYNKFALEETSIQIDESHEYQTRLSYLSEHAAALASSGKYRNGAKVHDKMTKIVKENTTDLSKYIDMLFFACDTWRCNGNFLKAAIRFNKASSLLKSIEGDKQRLEADKDRNWLLLNRQVYYFFKVFRLKPFAKKLQLMAQEVSNHASEYYRKNGDWYHLQQVGLWTERFNLMELPSVEEDEYEIPTSVEGYLQLNFPMGRMMAYRHLVLEKKEGITGKDVHQIRSFINDAIELGINPEVWKLSLLLILKAKGYWNKYDLFHFFVGFSKCQYTLFFRIVRLVAGE